MSDPYEGRRRARQLKLYTAVTLINQRVGNVTLEESISHVQIAALSSLAETRGLWEFMLKRGLITKEAHQDYLDMGHELVLAAIEQRAAKVIGGET